MEDNIVSSLGNLFTRAFPDVCNNGIKLLLCGDLASGKSMFALRLLLNCLQNCDEFTSFHYKALSTLLVSDHRKLWQRYPLQINVLPKNSTGETNCLLSLRYLNSTWNLQANDDSLTELEEYLNWLDEQGTLEANDGGALIPCFETVVQLNVTANSPNILKLTMLELPALIADSSPSKQVCCIHEINTCTQIDSNTKLVSKVIEYNNVEDFIMSYLQDRDHYIPLIFEHNEEANSKFIQLFK